MHENHLWYSSKDVAFQVSSDIAGNFDIGFDRRIPEETKDALIRFAYWVEDTFVLPITLWVDFKYNHYLLDDNKQRVAYKFYWVDFADYPVFSDPDDIPVIELAVRTERRSVEEILRSFIDAISMYYTWLANTLTRDTQPQLPDTEEILQAYLRKASM